MVSLPGKKSAERKRFFFFFEFVVGSSVDRLSVGRSFESTTIIASSCAAPRPGFSDFHGRASGTIRLQQCSSLRSYAADEERVLCVCILVVFFGSYWPFRESYSSA